VIRQLIEFGLTSISVSADAFEQTLATVAEAEAEAGL
jgi:hypothetical protein